VEIKALINLKIRMIPENIARIWLIHELDDLLLIGGVKWRHGNVSHSAELSAIIQVFVLQTEKVPDKPEKCF
jgi:hypothetical protein